MTFGLLSQDICVAAARIPRSSKPRSPPPRRCASGATRRADVSSHESDRRTTSSGVIGEPLEEVSRAVPTDEPPEWPPNRDLGVVGKPVPRLDAQRKVTGQ